MSLSKSSLPAIGYMLASVAFFSCMDAGMKLLSEHYPPLQITVLRGISSLPFVLVWVLMTAGIRSIIPVRWGLHLLRGILGMIMIGCFVYALKRLPLSTAYTIYFVAPLLITALSVPFLKEKVGPRRWTAIAVGLLGVLVVLRPGFSGVASFAGAMVLLAATAYAFGSITVRLLTRTDTSQAMVVWFLVLMSAGAAVLAIPNWVSLQWSHAWIIGVVGLAGALGQVTLTSAFQRGEASLIAPLEYTGLVWVIGLDWMIWQKLPDLATWIGGGIIISSGIYLFYRENVVAKQALLK